VSFITRLLVARTRISSTELAWIFTERLREFGLSTSVAIVPSKEGWTAVTDKRSGGGKTGLRATRVAKIERELRKIYALAKD
jgi:hypothetical protein